ncbi:methyltransferase domain-containing protein [Ferrimonas sediminicola]|uniref:tRNA1(Val) (adenine(37)-N6)-methyltransferase n=1 Tax=Ferrimonas sediminicola TaxID=2569538 RepID=A0A4U1BD28_9GAMM|nr:methyltransferase [Ferrimonas sediminicola]TKB48649.1 methyltransferase domain-containing protein [Ferrimonas sediminicola]
MGFSFKQFHIDDDRCGMKVSTDSVLLGSWARVAQRGRTLDLGCGSGLLALCCAQRSGGTVDALEIDPDAVHQARQNVAASPWFDRVQVHQGDLRCWSQSHGGGYQHLISNPPYFEDSLTAPCPKRAQARAGLSLAELLGAIERLLAPEGHASLVLPASSQARLQREAEAVGLNLTRLTRVSTTPAKGDKLILVELARKQAGCPTQHLVIHRQDGGYSDEYRALTTDFYLKG